MEPPLDSMHSALSLGALFCRRNSSPETPQKYSDCWEHIARSKKERRVDESSRPCKHWPKAAQPTKYSTTKRKAACLSEDVQSIQGHDEPSRDPEPVSGRQPVRRQSGAHAGRLSLITLRSLFAMPVTSGGSSASDLDQSCHGNSWSTLEMLHMAVLIGALLEALSTQVRTAYLQRYSAGAGL
jgi:hypothetical protein